MNQQIIIAGFGGQGILFMGKFLAYAGMIDGYQISWLPSYGPEMRGGTANCNVIISEESVGSPIITAATSLIAMNAPSFDKFVNTVVPGGKIVLDSTLVPQKCERTDVETFYVPATQIAREKELTGLANMIVLGKFLKATELCGRDTIVAAMKKCVSEKKAQLFEKNLEAIQIGFDF